MKNIDNRNKIEKYIYITYDIKSFFLQSIKNEIIQAALLGVATSYLGRGVLLSCTISGARLIVPRLISAVGDCWKRTRGGTVNNLPIASSKEEAPLQTPVKKNLSLEELFAKAELCFNYKNIFNMYIKQILDYEDFDTVIIKAWSSGHKKVTEELILKFCNKLSNFKFYKNNYIYCINNYIISLIDKSILEIDDEKKHVVEFFLKLTFDADFTDIYNVILNKYKDVIDFKFILNQIINKNRAVSVETSSDQLLNLPNVSVEDHNGEITPDLSGLDQNTRNQSHITSSISENCVIERVAEKIEYSDILKVQINYFFENIEIVFDNLIEKTHESVIYQLTEYFVSSKEISLKNLEEILSKFHCISRENTFFINKIIELINQKIKERILEKEKINTIKINIENNEIEQSISNFNLIKEDVSKENLNFLIKIAIHYGAFEFLARVYPVTRKQHMLLNDPSLYRLWVTSLQKRCEKNDIQFFWINEFTYLLEQSKETYDIYVFISDIFDQFRKEMNITNLNDKETFKVIQENEIYSKLFRNSFEYCLKQCLCAFPEEVNEEAISYALEQGSEDIAVRLVMENREAFSVESLFKLIEKGVSNNYFEFIKYLIVVLMSKKDFSANSCENQICRCIKQIKNKLNEIKTNFSYFLFKEICKKHIYSIRFNSFVFDLLHNLNYENKFEKTSTQLIEIIDSLFNLFYRSKYKDELLKINLNPNTQNRLKEILSFVEQFSVDFVETTTGVEISLDKEILPSIIGNKPATPENVLEAIQNMLRELPGVDVDVFKLENK